VEQEFMSVVSGSTPITVVLRRGRAAVDLHPIVGRQSPSRWSRS